jgi:hypothetical protein
MSSRRLSYGRTRLPARQVSRSPGQKQARTAHRHACRASAASWPCWPLAAPGGSARTHRTLHTMSAA